MKLRGVSLYSTLAAILIAAMPALAEPARDAAPATWRAVAASGHVEARTDEQPNAGWRRVKRGDRLVGGTEIQTGTRGRVTLVRTGAILIVDPQSRLVLPERHAPGIASTIHQSSGRVLYQIESSRSGPFEVLAPSLIAGVKGTIFLVGISADESVVIVDRGLVGVTPRAGGEQADVAAGEAALLDGIGRLQRVEADEIDRGRRGRQAREKSLRQARSQAGWPESEPGGGTPRESSTPGHARGHERHAEGESGRNEPSQGNAWGRDRDEVGDPWGDAGVDEGDSTHPGRGAGREEREAEDGNPGRRRGQSSDDDDDDDTQTPEGDAETSTGPGNGSRGSASGRGRGGSQ